MTTAKNKRREIVDNSSAMTVHRGDTSKHTIFHVARPFCKKLLNAPLRARRRFHLAKLIR